MKSKKLWIGIAILAVLGFIFWRRRQTGAIGATASPGASQPTAPNVQPNVSVPTPSPVSTTTQPQGTTTGTGTGTTTTPPATTTPEPTINNLTFSTLDTFFQPLWKAALDKFSARGVELEQSGELTRKGERVIRKLRKQALKDAAEFGDDQQLSA